MYGLPSSTEMRRSLPKKTIYSRFELRAAQRDRFDADISRIDIVAEVSPATVPALAEGERVKKFYLLDIQLKHRECQAKNLELLVRLIPQNLIFALSFDGEVRLALFCSRMIFSAWQPAGSVRIPLRGLNLDAVWDEIVASIGAVTPTEGRSVSEQIVQDDRRAKLLHQIEVLERKARSERQPRRKTELFEELKELKIELDK